MERTWEIERALSVGRRLLVFVRTCVGFVEF